MLKTILKIIIALVFVILAGAIYLAYSYKHRLENYVQDVITAEAKRSNVNLAVEEFKLNLLGAKAKALNLFLPKAFLSLSVDQPTVDVPLLSILSMAPALNFSGNFYESTVKGRADYNIGQKQTTANFNINNLDLTKMPQLAFLAVQKGMLNINLNEFRVTQTGPQAIQADYSIANLKTASTFSVPVRINGNTQLVNIPPIDDLSLSGKIAYNNFKLTFDEGTLRSDLGNSDFRGEITADNQGGIGRVFFNIQTQLSQKGSQYFGYLLPLFSTNITNSERKNFNITIEGKPYNLKYNIVPQ